MTGHHCSDSPTIAVVTKYIELSPYQMQPLSLHVIFVRCLNKNDNTVKVLHFAGNSEMTSVR